MSITVLGFIIYNVVNMLSFRDILKRFGFLKIARRDFYECGFRPTTQKPIRVPVQFLLICVFFLLYDIELVFLFPLVSASAFVGLFDLAFVFFFFSILANSIATKSSFSNSPTAYLAVIFSLGCIYTPSNIASY